MLCLIAIPVCQRVGLGGFGPVLTQVSSYLSKAI
jgi:hypothetical protein